MEATVTNVDRALLFAEWDEQDRCVVCAGAAPGSQYNFPHGHLPNCVMDLALSERGYCTQEKRDRARAFVADPLAHGMESCPCGKWAIPTVDVFIEAGDDGAPPKRVLAIVFCPHCGLRHEKPQGPPALVDGPYLEKPS